MKIYEIKGNLFESNDILVHCISSDCALGKGIAKQIDLMFGTKQKLYPYRKRINQKFNELNGFAVRTDRIINLVTSK